MDLGKYAFIAQQAAIKAGEILKEGFYSVIKITAKSSIHDVVTIFDTKAEDCIISVLKEAFPQHAFLGEESGLSKNFKDNVVWIVDPLDGTLNFSRQVPIFSISIAAVYNNQVLCGVVYQPMTNELFVATQGQGAFLNQEKLRVSTVNDISHGVFAIGFPYVDQGKSPANVDFCFELLKHGTPIRNLGSGALNMSYLAAGRFDGFLIPSLYAWDMAAGLLLIEEAGGKVTHQNGSPINPLVNAQPFDILATNGCLHEKLIALLKAVD